MSNSCPLSFKQVDSNVSRLTSLFVVVFVVSYLYTNSIFILFFLALDFIMRLFLNRGISPLSMLAEFFKGFLKLKDKFVDSGAKRLAGFFGLSFVLMLIAVHWVHIWMLTLSIAVVFLVCSTLDVLINYCIGCKIYFIIKKIYPGFMS
ncbi:MAG: DUF4395 family protein [Campylobacterota bacterium]|nr:DUF4395 family protein [Campylobacterota bacterium]